MITDACVCPATGSQIKPYLRGLYIDKLRRAEDITIFMTTHYMDEAEHCDRIAIMDNGRIITIDTPAALKASVGKDRVQLQTADDDAAIAALHDRFGLEAAMHDGMVTFAVGAGEQFVPRLFAELGVPIHTVSVARPSLDDVFMSYTGATIRDREDAYQRPMMPWLPGGMR